MKKVLRTAVFTLAALCGSVHASGLEALLMPGRVIEGHADIEKECGACHDANSDQAVAELCTNCHEDVGEDRLNSVGFHGRFVAARTNECVTCHFDHEGRDADIVGIDAGYFDHRWTDFPQTGAHLIADCQACHEASSKFRDAPSTCGDCHKSDDIHRGGLGDNCRNCHETSDWHRSTFDHGATGYPLTGGHAHVACIDCHQITTSYPLRSDAQPAMPSTMRMLAATVISAAIAIRRFPGEAFDSITRRLTSR